MGTPVCVRVCVCVLVAQLRPALSNLVDCSPLSMGFSRQEYRSGLPFPSPGDLPDPGIKPGSPTLQAYSLPSEPPRKPKNTGMGSLSILQGIFLTPGLKPGSPALQADSLSAELPGSPSTFRLLPVMLLEYSCASFCLNLCF